jgi:hypothetical protein
VRLCILDNQRGWAAQDLAHDSGVQRSFVRDIRAALDSSPLQFPHHTFERRRIELQLLLRIRIADEQLERGAKGTSELSRPHQSRLLGCSRVDDDKYVSWRFHGPCTSQRRVYLVNDTRPAKFSVTVTNCGKYVVHVGHAAHRLA